MKKFLKLGFLPSWAGMSDKPAAREEYNEIMSGLTENGTNRIVEPSLRITDAWMTHLGDTLAWKYQHHEQVTPVGHFSTIGAWLMDYIITNLLNQSGSKIRRYQVVYI